jgi:hypothetical protein
MTPEKVSERAELVAVQIPEKAFVQALEKLAPVVVRVLEPAVEQKPE